ncbi:hypothetical protein V4V35_23610 [Bacillus infantis]|jgi:predicted DNA-binding transcriptional regulator YafY|uniref:hypothetical protein n=1 Tax=Bacillus infantis TaxID=324767 RepID=UPI002FBD81AA
MEKLLEWSLLEQKCVDMIYQSEKGAITQRIIRVLSDQGEYIKAYCYFRKSERLFKRANILSVANIRRKSKRGA